MVSYTEKRKDFSELEESSIEDPSLDNKFYGHLIQMALGNAFRERGRARIWGENTYLFNV